MKSQQCSQNLCGPFLSNVHPMTVKMCPVGIKTEVLLPLPRRWAKSTI